jgi:hypothetical protein
MDRLSKAGLKAGLLTIELQLFLLINLLIFESNNHYISIFRAVGFTWIPFGPLNSVVMSHNRPKRSVGCCIGHFNELGLMG